MSARPAIDLRDVGLAGVSLAGLTAASLLGPVAALACGAAAGGALLGSSIGPRLPRWVGPTLAIAALGPLAWLGRDGVGAHQLLAALVSAVLARRWVARGSGREERAVPLLAGILLLLAAGRVEGPALAAPLVGWWIALPCALSPRPLPPRAALLPATVAVLLAAVAFLAAPRLARRSPPAVERTGFAAEVQLGALDELLDDPTVAFRATVLPRPEGPVYWRGVALDTFDGRRWTRGTREVPVEVLGPRLLPPEALVVEVEPAAETGALFVPGRVIELAVRGGSVLGDGAGGYRAAGGVERYRAVSLPPLAPGLAGPRIPEPDPEALARATSLPEPLAQRVRDLAAQVAGEGSPEEQVARLAAFVSGSFAYTRRHAGEGEEGSLEDFLFGSRAGHCESFATALAVLVRSRGLPARVVNGFVGGEEDPRTGEWVIRRYHAHSWTEVYLDGWVALDATPGPAASVAPPRVPAGARWSAGARELWERRVLAYDRVDQVEALASAARGVEQGLGLGGSGWVGVGGPILALGVVVGILAMRRGGRLAASRLLDPPAPWPPGAVGRAHERARRHLAAVGVRVPAELPPVEAARWVAERHPGPPAEALLGLAWLYYEVRLGGRDPGGASAEAARLAGEVARLRAEVADGVLPPDP